MKVCLWLRRIYNGCGEKKKILWMMGFFDSALFK